MLSKHGGIISLAQARFVAKHADILSPLELDFLAFYLVDMSKPKNKSLNSSDQSENPALDDYLKKSLGALENHLAGIFLKAVREHDGDRIKEIAKAVWYFEGKLRDDKKTIADPVRYALLEIRQLIETTKTPMDIHTVVSFVEFFSGVKIPGKEHSYPDFSEVCKELGVAIVRGE